MVAVSAMNECCDAERGYRGDRAHGSRYAHLQTIARNRLDPPSDLGPSQFGCLQADMVTDHGRPARQACTVSSWRPEEPRVILRKWSTCAKRQQQTRWPSPKYTSDPGSRATEVSSHRIFSTGCVPRTWPLDTHSTGWTCRAVRTQWSRLKATRYAATSLSADRATTTRSTAERSGRCMSTRRTGAQESATPCSPPAATD